ncbi:phosphonate ABC transporter, permease protein PhnE [Pseudovibrio exalbescens]|uniref:phosphonate ABC transporter, permease protein PhnE n=1 Tax=Pseudovibrio exalbescens TaxID=197461 RepID=UPI002365C1ED|nr:phosphonate ABC transporter, permease protein PhnE [Pseudovibrio exalbescens]MDD7908348.1 phosphonate ABC transporter, permease protein PhnE [Pseudovibrio exalbescens]
MTTVSGFEQARLEEQYPGVIEKPWSKRILGPAITVGILGYLVICFFAFDVMGVMQKARMDMAQLYALDSYAHKDHAKFTFRKPEEGFELSLEGTRRARYETPPAWFQSNGAESTIDLAEDGTVSFDGSSILTYYHPEYAEPFRFKVGNNEYPVYLGSEAPEWLKDSGKQIDARPSLHSRIWITRSKLEIHRYEAGWEDFWFGFHSPLKGMSLGQIVSLSVSGDRIDPDMSNLSFIASEFWYNPDWQHGDIFYALLQTLVMAVVGTLVAGIIALPLAFAAANNVNPFGSIRFGLRRIFDFLRGVDTLIWSLIFIRAFGLGPLSGTFAIIFTDTGTFGKLFSEAIENADRRQAEGIQATGASPVQKYRFGVFPQILPLFVSQMLYFLESNTRSATVIGALGAGGIGLKLLETMRTRQDWENTAYIIVLVIALVILMDNMSGWLRRKLIGGAEG